MSSPALLYSRKTLSNMGGMLNERAAGEGAFGDFGARMLAKFGWKSGEGLGKNKDGMATHIRVQKRAEGLGLGASATPPSEWAPPPPSRRTLPSGGDDGESSESSDDEREAEVRARIAGSSGVIPGLSDDQLFQLCGGARLGMRARSTQGGKLKRMEEADRAIASGGSMARAGESKGGEAERAGRAGRGEAAPGDASGAPTPPSHSAEMPSPEAGSMRAAKKAKRERAREGEGESAPTAKKGRKAMVSAGDGAKAAEKAARKAARKAAKKAARAMEAPEAEAEAGPAAEEVRRASEKAARKAARKAAKAKKGNTTV